MPGWLYWVMEFELLIHRDIIGRCINCLAEAIMDRHFAFFCYCNNFHQDKSGTVLEPTNRLQTPQAAVKPCRCNIITTSHQHYSLSPSPSPSPFPSPSHLHYQLYFPSFSAHLPSVSS